MASIQKMLKQAQKMQKNMEDVQSRLSQESVEYVGNGVKIIAKCDLSITSISIDKDLIESADDKDMLEDCLTIAVNNALNKARDTMKSEMDKVTAGLSIPGMM